MQKLTIGQRQVAIGISAAIDKSFSKFASSEHRGGVSFQDEAFPYLTFKLERCYRSNHFDRFASLEAFKNELIPSYKSSIMVDFVKRWKNMYLTGFSELGIPNSAPNFIKLGANLYTQSFWYDNRFKLSWEIFGGLVKPFFGAPNYVHINDRFFLANEYGFAYISHTEPAIKQCKHITLLNRLTKRH